jgi:hypothetical protein
MELSCKTATGKEYEIRFMGSSVIGVTSILYIEFIGSSMMEIVPVFSNASETSLIQGLVEEEVQKEYRGYTNLIEAIVLAESQNIRIALTVPIDVLGE